MGTRHGSALLVGVVAALAFATPADAQFIASSAGASVGANRAAAAAESPRPRIIAYGLRQVGAKTLDPFGSSGRREVLQLMPAGDGTSGHFQRSRMSEGAAGLEMVREEGWFQIDAGEIVLYFADERGATGRMEVARYQPELILGTDAVSGEALRYERIGSTAAAR